MDLTNEYSPLNFFKGLYIFYVFPTLAPIAKSLFSPAAGRRWVLFFVLIPYATFGAILFLIIVTNLLGAFTNPANFMTFTQWAAFEDALNLGSKAAGLIALVHPDPRALTSRLLFRRDIKIEE
ncbi:MAG: hypothetical protein KF836_12820 [Fimbriimonadaceae bacterium]|nr:hypothetical protein [Fimbriimonadaceae bacterium]